MRDDRGRRVKRASLARMNRVLNDKRLTRQIVSRSLGACGVVQTTLGLVGVFFTVGSVIAGNAMDWAVTDGGGTRWLVVFALMVAGLLAQLWWGLGIGVAKRRLYARHGVCPGCAYRLTGLAREDDGCVVCPECGAAWAKVAGTVA